MALHTFSVACHNKSLLPRDDAVNLLHFEVNAPETVRGTMDDIALAYQTMGGQFNSNYQNFTIKAYDTAPGPPIDRKDYTLTMIGGDHPTEVALCLSYSADDAAAGTPRRRGRIYLPWWARGPRPSDLEMTKCLDFGALLAQVGTFGNTTWMMRSATGTGTPLNPVPVFRKIESISVDNEYDTQRRRGMRSTIRTRRDVQ